MRWHIVKRNNIYVHTYNIRKIMWDYGVILLDLEFCLINIHTSLIFLYLKAYTKININFPSRIKINEAIHPAISKIILKCQRSFLLLYKVLYIFNLNLIWVL